MNALTATTWRISRIIARYGLSVTLVALAVLARFSLPSVLTGTPYLVFFPAVAISATLGGCGPGILATVLSVIMVDLLFDASFLHLGFEDPIWDARQAIFLVSGIGVSILARMLESARAHERQQAIEIAEQRSKYRVVADNTFDWEFWLSPDNIFIYNSPSCMNLTGYPAEAFNEKPDLLTEIIHPEDRQTYDLHRGTEDKACTTPEAEFRIIRKDGDVRWIHHSCMSVYGENGEFLGIRGTNRDITDRKLAELALEAAKISAECAKSEAERANQAKDRFLAMLSHELRTPLTPVLAAVSMHQKQHHLDHDIRNMLEMIHRNVELEARLIDDLLDITRIARGKIELHKRPIKLCSVIDRAVEVCRTDLDAKRLRLTLEIDRDSTCAVMGDVGRLQQVFWNLLKNAIKFTPEDGWITVRCQRDDNGGSLVEVSDNGIGIEPHSAGRIFDAFMQVEGATRQYGGLGLGLAICKALVELHGGSIDCQSDGKGQGSTFRVRLPLHAVGLNLPGWPEQDSQAHASGDAPAEVLEPHDDEHKTRQTLRILIVEDHEDSAEMLQLMLRSESHNVEVAHNMTAALEKIYQDSFDILVCDLGLPDGSGLDLMRTLRVQGRAVPGIALSGYGQESDVRQSQEAGFAAHLIKPVEMERLLATLHRIASVAPVAK